MLGNWIRGADKPRAGTNRFLRTTLDRFDVSRNRWLAISLFDYQSRDSTRVEARGVYKTLCSMGDLRTLALDRCNTLPFILTLNPQKNSSKIVLCPKLEEITLYIKRLGQFRINELVSMAKERASRDAKLSTITIISLDDASISPREMSQLREYVSRVEYKFGDAMPTWDTLPVMRV